MHDLAKPTCLDRFFVVIGREQIIQRPSVYQLRLVAISSTIFLMELCVISGTHDKDLRRKIIEFESVLQTISFVAPPSQPASYCYTNWNQLRGITSVPGLPTALNRIGIKFWGTEPPGSSAAWKERLRKERIARLQKIYGPCAERVTVDARSSSGVDRVFSVRCADLCMSLLRWRQGKWGFKRFMLCVCGVAYNFGHFRSCEQVDPRVSAVGLERLLTATHLNERYIRQLLTIWEAQLAATEGQTADESQLRPSTKKRPRPPPKSRRPEPSKDPPRPTRMTRSSAASQAAS